MSQVGGDPRQDDDPIGALVVVLLILGVLVMLGVAVFVFLAFTSFGDDFDSGALRDGSRDGLLRLTRRLS